MGFLLKPVLSLIVPLFSGYVTNAVMNLIDDVLKLTSTWSPGAKQAAVLVLATLITTVGQQFGLHLPTDLAAYTQAATWQPLVAAGMAFLIKQGQQQQAAKVAAPVAAPSK